MRSSEPGGASKLQSLCPVRRVAELGSLDSLRPMSATTATIREAEEAIRRRFIADGFQGTLNLETHHQRSDKNKELATRESLKALLEVISQV